MGTGMTQPTKAPPASEQDGLIVADIGGTNARVAALRIDADGGIEVFAWQRYLCADHAGLDEILRLFLSRHPEFAAIDRMVIASAGVVLADEVINSHLPWRVSLPGLRERVQQRELHLINDLEAAAFGTACLGPDDSQLLTPGVETARPGPVLVIGPGTGLGAAIRIWHEGAMIVLPTEVGMTAFAPGSEREIELLRWMRQQGHAHVATEQLLSGPGLVNIHRGLRALAGLPPEPSTPAAISAAARAQDAIAREAVLTFCTLLGSVIGDLAVISGARSAFIAGGIVPRLIDLVPESAFFERLLGKGTMRPVLEQMPVRVVLNERLGALGAAVWYRQVYARQSAHRSR